ncbi:MAG: aldehyde oxidase [Proteobacteria bacterium]|nr:aldehyde oxidase [Pseudomonadota bacterium]
MTEQTPLKVVGQSSRKIDGTKLALGRATFVDDIEMRGLLHCKVLWSPHAHARITRIDTSKAEALPGVHAVLCHLNVPRVPFTTAGQGHPEPSPYDYYTFDRKVRYVGDRVAAVAAETPDIAEHALSLIEVEYEVLPAVLSADEAMRDGAPIIHDEPESTGIFDAKRNLAARVEADVGDVEDALSKAEVVIDREYVVPYVQQVPIEPHVSMAWLDEDNRIVIRTSTQVPFHARRIVARALQVPVKRIRVIKPRIGGGFGAKQEVMIEDLVALLALRTGRPVKLEYTRAEEFVNSRTRHPQKLWLRIGATRDGHLTAMDLQVLANTGAYGSHALTVQTCTGQKPLSLYRCPNLRFIANVVYTNLPIAGAYRGYGVPQGFFAVESAMDELAYMLEMDPLALRQLNMVRSGDNLELAKILGEGKEGHPQIVESCGLAECIEKGAAAIGWHDRANGGRTPRQGSAPHLRRGIGVACLMHGTAIPGVDMGAASLKMNEDGSFNCQIGATDLGTGADTVIAQIVAETLHVPVDDVIVYAADTDMTPFDVGAYASSTTYISGRAAMKAALDVKNQILEVASKLLDDEPVEGLEVADKQVRRTRDGKAVTFAQVSLHSLYAHDQFQIQGVASYVSLECPPPFAAQFAEVEVDIETGHVRLLRFVSAVDCGQAINPLMCEGQIEGGAMQGMGYGLTEEYGFDANGRMINPSLRDYRVFSSADMPQMQTILVTTHEPSGPYGAKSVAEIPIDGPAPAITNAVYDAIGVRLRQIPLVPERVWRAMRDQGFNAEASAQEKVEVRR